MKYLPMHKHSLIRIDEKRGKNVKTHNFGSFFIIQPLFNLNQVFLLIFVKLSVKFPLYNQEATSAFKLTPSPLAKFF